MVIQLDEAGALMTIEKYRQACVQFAQVALSERQNGKTIEESRWAAEIATQGLTKTLPLELEVWLSVKKDQRWSAERAEVLPQTQSKKASAVGRSSEELGGAFGRDPGLPVHGLREPLPTGVYGFRPRKGREDIGGNDNDTRPPGLAKDNGRSG